MGVGGLGIGLLAATTLSPGTANSQEIAASGEQNESSALYGPPAETMAGAQGQLPVAIPEPLDRAASIAVASHPLVDSAEAEADALAAELRGARWGRYPSLSVEALIATRGSSIADSDGIALNAAIEQPIWSGGRIDSEIDRAEASLRAGESRVDATQRELVLRVIDAYYNVLFGDQRLAVLRDSLDQHRRLLESIGRRVEQEVSPLADLTLGRSRTSQVELDLSSTQEARDDAALRLSQLTGGAEITPTLPLPSAIELLPPEEIALDEALACDPSLAALTSLVAAAEARSDGARAQLWPQVLLQLSQNEITGARAALVVRMQLGRGGSQFAAIASADARIRRALADFGEAERQAREDLRRDYIIVRNARDQIRTGGAAADAADQIVASYQRQFIAGRRSWLDVMNAVREAAGARLTESDARVMAAMATTRILARTCRWQPQAMEGQA